MTKILTTRVDSELAKRVEEATKKRKVDKASFLRLLITKGLEGIEKEEALACYEKGEISLGKLAELLHFTVWDAITLLQEEKIPFHYGKEDLEEDLEDYA